MIKVNVNGPLFNIQIVIKFSLFYKDHHKFASSGFTICTHTTSLTFDLGLGKTLKK